MTRKAFEGEFGAILNLLREHSYLLYSSATIKEYESKLEAASAHFRSLVRDTTAIELPPDRIIETELDRARLPVIASAIHILDRAGSIHMRELAASASRSGSGTTAANPWHKAAEIIKSLK